MEEIVITVVNCTNILTNMYIYNTNYKSDVRASVDTYIHYEYINIYTFLSTYTHTERDRERLHGVLRRS